MVELVLTASTASGVCYNDDFSTYTLPAQFDITNTCSKLTRRNSKQYSMLVFSVPETKAYTCTICRSAAAKDCHMLPPLSKEHRLHSDLTAAQLWPQERVRIECAILARHQTLDRWRAANHVKGFNCLPPVSMPRRAHLHALRVVHAVTPAEHVHTAM